MSNDLIRLFVFHATWEKRAVRQENRRNSQCPVLSFAANKLFWLIYRHRGMVILGFEEHKGLAQCLLNSSFPPPHRTFPLPRTHEHLAPRYTQKSMLQTAASASHCLPEGLSTSTSQTESPLRGQMCFSTSRWRQTRKPPRHRALQTSCSSENTSLCPDSGRIPTSMVGYLCSIMFL